MSSLLKSSKTKSQNYNNSDILSMSFNQDVSCFCIGNKKGYIIFKSYPIGDNCKREINMSISLISMLYKTNIIAFVKTTNTNELIIWDDSQNKILTKIKVAFNIKNIKLSSATIFIIGEYEISVYSLNSFEFYELIKTSHNINGVLGISKNINSNIIAYPSVYIGEVSIKNYNDRKSKEIKIKAHHSDIAAIGVNSDGSLVATSSEKGTVIRIFTANDGMLLQEVRRGTEQVEIYSLVFDYKSQYLACSSSKGTVHIFNVKSNNNNKDNSKSILGSMASYLGIQSEYLKTEWSFAQFHVNCKGKNIVEFCPGNNHILIIITSEGFYFLISFNQMNGGECFIECKKDFIAIKKEDEDDIDPDV